MNSRNKKLAGLASIMIVEIIFLNIFVWLIIFFVFWGKLGKFGLFQLGPGSGKKAVVVVAVGDIVCGEQSGSACKQRETADLASQINPDAVLALGDTQYEKGEYENFVKFYDSSWGRFKSITHPAVGNHEYLTPKATGYFDYFNGVGNTDGPAGQKDKGYYAFDLGQWRLYALNSNCSKAGGCSEGSEQENWLKQDLTAHKNLCSLLYMHHPLWSSQLDYQNNSVRPLVKAFYQNGGDLILVGHSHFYERFAPQDFNGEVDEQKGMREFIIGTGGRNLYKEKTISQNSELRNFKTFGVLKLILNPASYEWQFVPVAGQTFTDSGTSGCH